jgi:Photosynthetic reaction centre cytochrome C subunit
MPLVRTKVLLIGLSVAVATVRAASQNRDVAAGTAPNIASNYKATNLKVLPKTISGEELDKLMHQYQQYIGQSCAYCHDQNPETKQLNFASDENPAKDTARLMISMTNDLNTKYLAQLGDRRYADPFTCGNCHRGQVQPPAFDPKAQP